MNSFMRRIRKLLLRGLLLAVVIAIPLAGIAWYKLFRPLPQNLADESAEEYFKYGSIGAEEEEGMPYYVWMVLPRMFPEYLPKDENGKPLPGGYAAFGAAWEQGRETPVGFSKRTIGFPRVAINCALCHTATYRETADGKRRIVPTGPSSRFDSLSYLRFLADCASDPRFNADNLLAQIQYNTKLSLLDRLLYRYVIIPRTKTALLNQKKRYAWTYHSERPRWGHGRIDPFNPVKFGMLGIEDDGTIGNSDMMPLWNMDSRSRPAGDGKAHLHWDGLNTDLTEVVLSGALGDGATNKSLPVQRLKRIERYIRKFDISKRRPLRFKINHDKAAKGAELFKTHCFDCHGTGGRRTETVIPISEIGTDDHRARMWTDEAVDRYSRFADGYPWDFKHFENAKEGYVAVPLNGLWLRAPYLHNGSVPTVADLLKPECERPKEFYRGYDVLDWKRLGFISTIEEIPKRELKFTYKFDVGLNGNSNKGHNYGTQLTKNEKESLVEYLKTL